MLAARNNADQNLAHVKDFGDVRITDSYCTHAADQNHIVVGEFGLEWGRRKSAETLSVSRIVSMGTPFKISDNIVGLDRVDVVHDRKVVGVRNERHSDQSVNVERGRFSIFVENQSWISACAVRAFVDLRSQHTANATLGMAIRVENFSRNASHVSERTNFVAPLVTNDGSPFFNDSGIHKAGRPSGVIGLMIKDPPRATTFGGSAFMARHSEGCNLTLQ